MIVLWFSKRMLLFLGLAKVFGDIVCNLLSNDLANNSVYMYV